MSLRKLAAIKYIKISDCIIPYLRRCLCTAKTLSFCVKHFNIYLLKWVHFVQNTSFFLFLNSWDSERSKNSPIKRSASNQQQGSPLQISINHLVLIESYIETTQSVIGYLYRADWTIASSNFDLVRLIRVIYTAISNFKPLPITSALKLKLYKFYKCLRLLKQKITSPFVIVLSKMSHDSQTYWRFKGVFKDILITRFQRRYWLNINSF